jgi:Integrase zinc binding domain/Integrase core domain
MDLKTLKDLTDYLETSTYPQYFNSEQKSKMKRQAQQYLVRNGTLYKRNRQNSEQPLRVISEAEKDIILYNMHSDPLAGHFAVKGTVRRILERYYWPTIREDVKNYIRSCDACQRRGKPQTKEPLHPIQVGQPFSRVGIDVVGPLNETKNGNKYIITATDYLTKWVEARAVRNAKKEDIAQFLWEEIICRHGCPRELLSDRGAAFVSKIVERLLLIIGTTHRLSSAYHPQTNGLTERFNKTLCESLAKTASQHNKQWDIFLSATLFAYRTLQQSTTKQTPFFLTYGRQAVMPVQLEIQSYPEELFKEEQIEEILQRRMYDLIGTLVDTKLIAKENIQASQQLQKERHDRKIKNEQLQEEDLVLEYRSKDQNIYGDKFQPKWDGPFVINTKLGKGAYILRTLDGKIIQNRPVHGNRLKKYYQQEIVEQTFLNNILL